jgi:hypothetical protein
MDLMSGSGNNMTIVNKENIAEYFRNKFNARVVVKAGSDLVEWFRQQKGVALDAQFTVEQFPYRFRDNKSIIEPILVKEGEAPSINPEWVEGKYEAVIAHLSLHPEKFQIILYRRNT